VITSMRIRWVAAVVLLGACGSEPPPVEEPLLPVRTFVVGSDMAGGAREYAGVVEAAQSAQLGFEVAGRVEAFPVVEGQRLARGGLVARIDPTDYVANRDAAAANRLAAEADYERYRSLYASDVVSLQELEVRRRNFEVADASFRTAQKALDDTRLRAPFDGVVAMKLVPDFANVQAKQPVVLFEDNSSLKVVFDIPERDAALAQPRRTLAQRTEDLRPTVELSAYPGRTFPARFLEVATAADPVTRTFRITLALARPDDVQMAPGMTVLVRVAVPRNEPGAVSLRIPASGLGTDGEGPFVLKVVGDENLTVERARVSVGAAVGDDVEIPSGLTVGDRIVLSAVRTLRPGAHVRLMGQ
jgi:RND family efflux transporter MFP subunit